MHKLKILFSAHPDSVGESWGTHCLVAGRFGISFIAAGLACFVHAIFPFLFVKTGSRTIIRLHEEMVSHRRRAPLVKNSIEPGEFDPGFGI